LCILHHHFEHVNRVVLVALVFMGDIVTGRGYRVNVIIHITRLNQSSWRCIRFYGLDVWICRFKLI